MHSQNQLRYSVSPASSTISVPNKALPPNGLRPLGFHNPRGSSPTPLATTDYGAFKTDLFFSLVANTTPALDGTLFN